MALINLGDLWQYQARANTVPANPGAVAVPSSGWLGPAPAPFGTIGPSFQTGLNLGTPWAVNTGLWVRRGIVTDGSDGVRLRGQIDNAAFIYVDGQLVGQINPGNDAAPPPSARNNLDLIIPKSRLAAGTHQLAILLLSDGSGADTTFFWLEADYSPPVMSLWPRTPMQEAIAWLTDLSISENGTEEREQVRDVPRHSYRMSAFVPIAEQRRVANMLYGQRGKQWLVPIWSQVRHLGQIVAGETSLAFDTRFAEYRAGSPLLLWQSPQQYQVCGVDDVTSDEAISLSTPTEAFTDAYVMPVRAGYLESDPQRAFNGRQGSVDLAFAIEDNAALAPAAPAQYLGDDFYSDVSLLDGGSLTESIVTAFDLIDEQLGLVSYRTPWRYNRPSRVHRMMGDGMEEAWAIRQFLHRRAGRYRQFWQPTFESDLKPLNTGNVTTSLTVAADGYLRFAADRKHIAIETPGGWLPRRITATLQTGANQVQLTLDSSIATPAAQIGRVSFLGRRAGVGHRVEVALHGGRVE